jgi:ComF family protein
MPMIKNWLETLITFIYPAKCRRCEVPMGLERIHYICDSCWEQIEFLTPPWCRICGIPLDYPEDAAPDATLTCTDCRMDAPPYDRLRAVAFYEPTMREAIHLFKYQRKQVLAEPLIQLIIDHLPDDLATEAYDLLLPIPLHRKRLRERGFNQAEQLAKGIAKVWNVPIGADVLRRVRDTAPQSSLESRHARRENIADAFEVHSPELIQGRRILLIDDIFTTGTTIYEALKVLKAADAAGVDVLTLSRTKP